MSNILTLLRLRTLLSQGHPDAMALQLDEIEGAAIFSSADILLGLEGDEKQALLTGFLSGKGDFQGTTCECWLTDVSHVYLRRAQMRTFRRWSSHFSLHGLLPLRQSHLSRMSLSPLTMKKKKRQLLPPTLPHSHPPLASTSPLPVKLTHLLMPIWRTARNGTA